MDITEGISSQPIQPAASVNPLPTGEEQPPSNHKFKLILAVGLVFVVVALGFGSFFILNKSHTEVVIVHPSPKLSPNSMNDAEEVAKVLKSLSSDPESAIATSSKAYIKNVRAAISPQATVIPYTNSWAPDGISGGTMKADVIEPAKNTTVTYLVLMVHESTGWKVSMTIEASSNKPTQMPQYSSSENDIKRTSDINEIFNAINIYMSDNFGNIPSQITTTPMTISDTGANICSLLIPMYMDRLPSDPTIGNPKDNITNCNAYVTGYTLVKTGDNEITVSAYGEQKDVISVSNAISASR